MQCIDGLVYSYKEMLGKVMTQKTQQFLAFLCYQEKQKKSVDRRDLMSIRSGQMMKKM